jgi:hypothetical protein
MIKPLLCTHNVMKKTIMQLTKLMHHNGNQGFVHIHKSSPNFDFKITTKISNTKDYEWNGNGLST